MITRLEVDGFKSLRGFAVDLEPFTVFIGPNGAGKSNILEALALLSQLSREPIVDAFKRGRGRPIDQFSRHGGEIEREIRFAAEFLFFGEYEYGQGCVPNRLSRFRYELVIERVTQSSGTEHLLARHELLRCLRCEEDTWVDEHPEFAALVNYHDGERHQFIVTPERATTSPEAFPEHVSVDRRRTYLAQAPTFVDAFVPANLDLCQWVRLDMAQLARPSDRVDTGALRPDGSNLATVLADLPAAFLGEIRADLVTLVPGLSSFTVVSEGDAFHVEFELSGGERLPARLVSDGTLRILALLTALRLEPRPYLIGVEEPENGVYPGRLRALVELLRTETERRLHEEPATLCTLDDERAETLPMASGVSTNLLPTQILVTTHSPVILAALRRHLKHLRLVDTAHRDGRRVTRARAVGRPTADRRHLVVSPREIDEMLNAAASEGGE